MNHHSKVRNLVLASGALSLVIAGGLALAQPGDGGDASPGIEIVRDDATIELAWIDADGTTGTEAVILDVTDAPDHNASGPSPSHADPPEDPLKS